MYRAVCLLVFVSGALGQVILQGECNYATLDFVTDLNVTQMFGTWHQIARIDNSVETGDCSSVTVEGTYDGSGSLSGVQVSYSEFVNKTKSFHNGTLDAEVGLVGMYNLNLAGFLQGQFVVQATNYTDFAILYSCYTVNQTSGTTPGYKMVLAWQYHRTASLSTSQQNSIKEIINANPDLNNTTWRQVNHDKVSCGNGGISVVPQIFVILASVFISKDFF